MKKKINWLIQSNQTTPIIHDFLKTQQLRMENFLDICFIIPDSSSNLADELKDLNPVCFKTATRSVKTSHEAYRAKKMVFNQSQFPEGLAFSDVLLLDDLGGGNVIQTSMALAGSDNTCGLIIQIPTPLGSSETEERVFHAAILWAKQNRIPVIGYELLPLDTRWTLAASLPDGIITRYEESYEYLKKELDHANVWQLPFYESSIFSSVSTVFNLNGAKAAYHYRKQNAIPVQRTILYIPHNVAMIYEYQELLKIIIPTADSLHLMFSFGEDQVRGAYTHKEIIQTVYHNELKKFASYSFHNINNPWEMLAADCIIACSACFQTNIAREKNIPSIIFDPILPPMDADYKKRVNKKQDLLDAIKKTIALKFKKREFGDIIMQLARPEAACE